MKHLTKIFAVMALSVCSLAAMATDIPLIVGNYLTTSESATTGTINNNDGGNLGSIQKGATATFTLSNASAQEMVLSFLTGNNNSSNPTVTVTLNDGSSDFFTTGAVAIENPGTGNWNPVTMHTFDLGTVPAGTISLTFAFDNSGSYVCNLGSIGLYNKEAYLATLDEMPGDVDKDKGVYLGGARWNYSNNGKVGWLSNNTAAYYPSLYAASAGTASLNIGMKYNGDGTLNVKIVDLSTGDVEVNENLAITSAVCQGLTTPTAFELGEITAGFKSMKLTVSTSASYLIDYQDLSLGLSASTWQDIAIDLRSGQLGTSGSDLQKYLTVGETYSYSDDEPSEYNAILYASSFNGSDHGYVGLKATVPVEAGIYKITLGTCQYGTGTACVKNSAETQTLNVINAAGKTVTSINQNDGTCYHVNTTTNVVSMWYTAESDEIIKVVCGNYTPYFAIEKVDAVPELKYTVTYVNDTEGASGTVPAEVVLNDGESVTIPANYTLYKNGYTLTGWNDGTTTHAIGASVTPEDDVTLTAVFTENVYGLDESLTDLAVRWDFQRNNGCPLVQWQNRTGDFLVTQVSINGQSIDVQLGVNTNPGKFNNSGNTDWCQVNTGTTFTFPTAVGSTVKIYTYNAPTNESPKATIEGATLTAISGNEATFTINSTSGSSALVDAGGGYYRYIEVTYPAAEIVLPLKALTVDGVEMDGEILAAINTADDYAATFSDNVYTTVPTVVATFADDSQLTGVATGSGASRVYTFEKTLAEVDYTFTLTVEGIHVYAPTGDEVAVNIKHNEGTVEDNVWTNGVYTFTTSGIGSSGGADFKFDANTDVAYTISMPVDVVVKQFIIKNFHANYSGGDGQLKTVTSTGATTYLPTRRTALCNVIGGPDNRKYEGEAYDLIVTIEDHEAGTPIVFTMKKSAQPMGWIQLTTVKEDPGTAPVKTADNVIYEDNDAVVAVTFDREIVKDVTATINGGSVTAKGGSSTLYFPVWNLNYSSSNTLSIAAEAVEDNYGNKNASAINIAVNIPAKTAVTPATYDYVVSNVTEFLDAVAAVNLSNTSASAARKTIFIKNGDYNFGDATGDGKSLVQVRAYNVSFIGESRDGVILHGNDDGISNPVLNLRDRTGFYLQDLTVRNDRDYGNGLFNGGVAVAIYGGDKTIMKNVRMLSNQDTQVTGHRAYFEDCEIHGSVDFICGGGDNYYYHTDLVLEDRAGNCITAPSTNSAHQWGYVFDHCTIKAVDGATQVTDGNFDIGRPWQNEPRANFLYTTMNVLCSDNGWGGMSSLPTHFYEYKSYNGAGSLIDLSTRGNSPTSTNSYTPVLTDGEAAAFTVHNVLGGTDAWDAAALAAQVSAPSNIAASGYTITWNAVADALLYAVFKDGEYLANTTSTTYTADETGSYTVKAANRFGGLSAASAAVEVVAYNYVRVFTHKKLNTLCFPYEISSYAGATFYTLLYKEMESSTVTDVVLEEHIGALEAGKPYFYVPDEAADRLTCTYAGEAAEAQKVNGVQGCFADNTHVPEGSYVTYDGALRQAGSQVYLGEYRAYVDMDDVTGTPVAPKAGRKVLRVRNADAPAIATGMENVQTGVQSTKVLRNGQLFIIRDGNTYNAQGQLVQ